MNIAKDSVVAMHYTLKDDAGEIIDSSAGGETLAFIFGSGQIIPGLEEQLEGKVKGEKLQATIPPEKAYGPRNEEMVQSVEKSQFEEPDQIKVGVQFQADTEQGPVLLTVLKVDDKEVLLDSNHPLAGKTLHFDVEITDVRAASAEELEHGHVHGPGGHQH